MKRYYQIIKSFFKMVFRILKLFMTIRGILSLVFIWLLLSGMGLYVLGVILKETYFKVFGLTIFAFWAGPFTPLIPLVLIVAGMFAKFVLRDNKISIIKIKEIIQNSFKDVEEVKKNYLKHAYYHGIVIPNDFKL